MDRQVFISYAAGDADWTAERVEAFADMLDTLGVSVHLDVRYQESLGQNIAPAVWREWMDGCLSAATNVVCLCSERYAQAWQRKESLSGGCGVAFESARIERHLYDSKQNNHGRVIVVVSGAAGSDVVPGALKDACPKYEWGNSKDDRYLRSHLSGRTSVASSTVPIDAESQGLTAHDPASTEIACPDVEKNAQETDLLDLAWRKALEQSTASVRAALFMELLEDSERKGLVPENLQEAIADAFGREQGPTNLLARVKFALHKSEKLAPQFSPEERHERTRLCLMLLVRSAALVCRSGLQGKVMGDLTVPERERRLAIAVAAHVIFGQGVRLVVEPGGVRPDNLIDTFACEDAQAHMPGQAPARTPLEKEVDAWLQRVSGATHTAQTTADLKAYLDAYEQEAHSRPILLDGERMLLDRAVRRLAADLRMGIVDIAADDRPANIPQGVWLDLCDQLDRQIAELTAAAPARSPIMPLSAATQPEEAMTLPVSAPQVTVQQTIYGGISQSNLSTGSHGAIHADQSSLGAISATHDPLAAAVLGFQMVLNVDSELQADLRALHPLLLRRQLSSNDMLLLRRVLPSLRRAGLAPEASEAWARLRAVVHAYWPDSRGFFY